jgi:hypothetical protein
MPDRLRATYCRAVAEASIDPGARATLRGFEQPVELVGLRAWPGIGPDSQRAEMRDWAGLAQAAASTRLSARKTDRAVELLEHGRAVMWTHSLNTRSDLAELGGCVPQLAQRLDSVRRRLESVDAVYPARGSPAPHDRGDLSQRCPGASGAAGRLTGHLVGLDGR